VFLFIVSSELYAKKDARLISFVFFFKFKIIFFNRLFFENSTLDFFRVDFYFGFCV